MNRIIDGVPMSKDEVIVKFRRMVYKYAYRLRKGHEAEDLVQEGFIGLLKAYDTYDPDRGVTFVNYAGQQIYFSMLHSLRGHYNGLKFPNNIMQLAHRLIREDLRGIPPIEIAEQMGEEVVHVKRALEYLAYRDTNSLDQKVAFESDMSMHDIVGKSDDHTEIEMTYLMDLILSDVEKSVVERTLYGDTQTEIAKLLDMSQVQVSRMLHVIRKKIKREMTRE